MSRLQEHTTMVLVCAYSTYMTQIRNTHSVGCCVTSTLEHVCWFSVRVARQPRPLNEGGTGAGERGGLVRHDYVV